MTEQKKERGIKVMVKRKIRLAKDKDGKAQYVLPAAPVGEGEQPNPPTIVVITVAEAKAFGSAVTRDLPLEDDD